MLILFVVVREPENSDSSQATTKQNGEAVPTSQLGPVSYKMTE